MSGFAIGATWEWKLFLLWLNLAVFSMVDNRIDVPLATIALARVPGVFRGERSDALHPHALNLFHRVMVDMAHVDITVGAGAPILRAINGHQ